MKIKYGTTRIVIIFDHFVIKIPLIRFFFFFKRFFIHASCGNVRGKVKEHRIGFRFIFNYFTPGFKANRNEYRFSKANPHREDIIPVLFFFFGCVIIQPRGTEIPAQSKRWRKHLKKILRKNISDGDQLVSYNYSFWKGKICLHDYGNMITTNELRLV